MDGAIGVIRASSTKANKMKQTKTTTTTKEQAWCVRKILITQVEGDVDATAGTEGGPRETGQGKILSMLGESEQATSE